MSHKINRTILTFTALLIALFTLAAARGWERPLAQMEMPTGTMEPSATSVAEDTPAPLDDNMPSPTWTSIFIGYTPYPRTSSTYYPYMGGSGMGGGCGGMGAGGMGMGSGYTTDGTPIAGMGNMGGMGSMGGSMDMGSCPMMSGSSSMSGMNMSGGYSISGMDISGMSGYVEQNTSVFSDPWLLIGWVLLGLLVLAILAGAGLGIAWIVRRSRQIPPA